jgi:hypothetical protein
MTIQNFQICDTFYLGDPNSNSHEVEANYHPPVGSFTVESRGKKKKSAPPPPPEGSCMLNIKGKE